MDEELLVPELSALGGAVEAEEGLRRVGLACEQLLERRMPAGAPAREALQGAVAVEHGALAVDDLEPGVEPVRDRLDELGLGDAIGHAQMPGHEADREEDAGHRQQRQQAEQEERSGPAEHEHRGKQGRRRQGGE